MYPIRALALALILATGSTAAHAGDPLTVLVTGANRGIGLEYARQFADKGYRVIGTARDPAKATDLAAVADRVEALDVSDAASVAALAARLDGEAIDILVNNAGVFDRGDVSIEKVDFAQMEQTFAVNTLGPLRVVQALLPNLRKGQRKLIVNMSSQLGSISGSTGTWYAYRSSKAALNQITKTMSAELGKEGFVCVVVHPGWVRTDMGGDRADIDAPTSVAGIRQVIASLDAARAGRFWMYDGSELPW